MKLYKLALSVIGLVLMSCQSGPQLPEKGVYFKNLQYGAVVSSPFKIEMGIADMEVKPAGKIIAGTGHHHLIINEGSIPAGQMIPADKKHIHFGKGQTETELHLEPGTYELTLQFANGVHQSYGPKYSKTIAVTVK